MTDNGLFCTSCQSLYMSLNISYGSSDEEDIVEEIPVEEIDEEL